MESHDLLKSHHLRITPIRQKVLEVFLSRGGEAIPKMIIEESLVRFDRVTLYRTLKQFEEKGLIHEVIDTKGQAKYALCATECTTHEHHDDHLHFHCSHCDRTICVDGEVNLRIDLPSGFKVEDERVVLKGQCDRCA
ncbi:MAG TPA: transcriptional repressor [Bacteroidetes bacterium]|nr:transcriptional repressor [Bacteroidota bacterium]